MIQEGVHATQRPYFLTNPLLLECRQNEQTKRLFGIEFRSKGGKGEREGGTLQGYSPLKSGPPPVVWKALSELRYFFRFATYHPTNDWFFKGKFMHT